MICIFNNRAARQLDKEGAEEPQRLTERWRATGEKRGVISTLIIIMIRRQNKLRVKKAESHRGGQMDGRKRRKRKRSGISALLAAPVPVARLPSADERVKSISGATATQLRGLHRLLTRKHLSAIRGF